MSIPVTVPRLGWNMEEGVFAGWLKQDGDTVRPGDTLFSLESDKATEDVETLDGGTLRIPPDGPHVGDRLPVGKVIAYLVQAGETVAFPDNVAASPVRTATEQKTASSDLTAGPAARRLAREMGVDLRHVAASGPAGRVTTEDVRQHQRAPAAVASRPAISPRARRVAAELDVDWTGIRGSGKTGRIRERDVRALAGQAGSAIPPPAPLSPTRRTIAERMLHSARSTAPVTLTTQADATNLVNLRGQFQSAGPAAANPVPGYTDFFVKLAAVALQQQPQLNIRWENGQLVQEKSVHIGIAVDTEAGLLVPVVRDAHGLNIRQLAARSRDLTERARSRKLSAAEMQGGTFTVSSLGAYGIDAFSPVINYPQVAILGVGAIRRQPVAVGEQVVIRDVITLSLTFDHCAVDGAPAARFLQALCKIIEAPGPWLLS
jgi:pyruvate dehydrogenase E2 component (dihydrolipoamide acetyltransferase)